MGTTRRGLLQGAMLLAAGLAGAPLEAAAEETPERFLRELYKHYTGDASKGAVGIPLDSHKKIRRYFTPELATLILKDQDEAAKRGEVPNLDGDPFVDAQDWNIDTFDVDVAENAPGKAKATVKFVNLDQPATVVLDLVKIGKDWRIADITWLREGKQQTLRSLYLR